MQLLAVPAGQRSGAYTAKSSAFSAAHLIVACLVPQQFLCSLMNIENS